MYPEKETTEPGGDLPMNLALNTSPTHSNTNIPTHFTYTDSLTNTGSKHLTSNGKIEEDILIKPVILTQNLQSKRKVNLEIRGKFKVNCEI